MPSGVRAITLMHARHGSVPWQAVVAPGERLARLGVPVSRALSRDLQAGAAVLGADSEARRIFGRGSGTAVTEGDNFIQTDLAATLGIIRQRGGGDFFSGSLARVISEQVTQIGGSLPLESLRNAVPQSGPPAGESYGGFKVYVAPAPMAGAQALAGWKGQPRAGRRGADQFGRHRRASRRSTTRAARRPAACRWASCSGRASWCPIPASCSARRPPTARR